MLAPARYGCAAWSIRQAWNRERSSSVPRSRYQGAWYTSPLAVYTAIAGITTGWWWPWARTAQGHCSPTRSQPRAWGAWAPPGPVVDSEGRLYVAVGNGAATSGDWDRSDSVLRLSPTLQLE